MLFLDAAMGGAKYAPFPVFKASTVGTPASGSTALTINRPTSVEGDMLVACVATQNGGNVTASPTGWTSIAFQTFGDSIVYYKVAGASEPASYTWTISGATNHTNGAIVSYGKLGTTTTFRAASSMEPGGFAEQSFIVPAVTTSVPGCVLLVLYIDGQDTTTLPATPNATVTSTTPGCTQRLRTRGLGGNIIILDRGRSVAGSTGTTVLGVARPDDISTLVTHLAFSG